MDWFCFFTENSENIYYFIDFSEFVLYNGDISSERSGIMIDELVTNISEKRYHLDKHYLEEPVMYGDVSLIQIGRLHCTANTVIGMHLHRNWFEFTVVRGGRGTISTNGVDTAVSSGDIYVSFPCDVHEIRIDLGERMEYDFFAFYTTSKTLSKALKSITQNFRGGDKRIFQDSKISQLVEYAISEFTTEEKPFLQSALGDIFHLIIVYLIRNFNDIQQKSANVSQPEILCFQLMNYIDTHIYTIKNLKTISPKFNYNYGYLSGLFKRTTGKTLSEYHQLRKMETGKALVLEKKKSIGEIAEMLGYNLYSFSKAFKRTYGISPKNLQKQGNIPKNERL